MKRKKWSELEERTLITKYSDLRNSGALAKLKTREKKFRPIADHVNALHHLRDPVSFPFKWTWRDVSIKVQNMRHQYLGVKQKIKNPDGEFNWSDGENHWENFLMYKEVFGDLELDLKEKRGDHWGSGVGLFESDDGYELGFDGGEEGSSCSGGGGGREREGTGDSGSIQGKRLKGGRVGLLGGQVLQLRDFVLRREERRREREVVREDGWMAKEESRRENEILKEGRRRDGDGRVEVRELELEEMQFRSLKRTFDKQTRLEREFDEERRWRMRMEEKREEEEMEWKERMLGMQIEHEKQMMQMYADTCHNQMQVLGIMARLVCQFFGSASDGLGGALGAMPTQMLQNLQHSGQGSLADNGKPDPNTPSEFL